MVVFEVLDGGLHTTVQDLGRPGYQRYGVPTSGAMDRSACRVANLLAGNSPDAAVLEMTFVGPRLKFLSPATIALAGADLGAQLDDEPLPSWRCAGVVAGRTLSFAGPRDGLRCYMAILGGIEVPAVLGSRSTYTRSRLGGLEGRALAEGDRLGIPGDSPIVRSESAGVPTAERPVYGHEHVLRVILGPQDDRFTPEGVNAFLSSEYRVTQKSDRMGYRLEGPPIAHARGADIVSDGSPLGAVQVTGDGQPIVLMADRGTAGGYAKVATVIGVDVGRLAQASPGDAVRFERIDLAGAHAALRAHEEWLEWLGANTGAGVRGLQKRQKAAAAAAAVARILGKQD